MNGRDERGRFIEGNDFARIGGLARAASLDAVRRSAIARAGWQGLVDRHFDGDTRRAGEWLGQLGAWATDAAYRDRFPVFEHPGPCPGGGE